MKLRMLFGKHIQKPQMINRKAIFSLEWLNDTFLGGHQDHISLIPLWPNRPTKHNDIRAIILKEISKNTNRKEAMVLRLRFFDHLIWEDVAIRAGFSRQWCKRLEARGLIKLRRSKRLQALISDAILGQWQGEPMSEADL